MAAPDMDVIKEIPGYKVILKAVLKSQIQQLVEQLAMHTEEESIILTASISDGTLSHLGSDSGKSFLDDYEDVKSQFLGFCLKHHHKKKQKEKEREELERQRQMMPTTPTRFTPRTPRYASPRGPQFSPRFSPRQPSFTVRSPNARHAPYPVSRPMKGPSLNLNRQDQTASGNQGAMKLPLNNQVIKIEPDEDGSNSNTGDASKQTESSSSQPGSPSHTPSATVKSDSTEDNDKSNSSSSTIPTEASDLKHSDTQPAEGLSLDSDLSSLISGDQSESGPSTSAGQPAEHDPNVSVKVEAISESEMELEITGVEPGRASVSSQDTSWAQNTSMGYESGASGNQADLQTQEGYKIIGMRRRRNIRIRKEELLLILRAYVSYPNKWANIIDEVKANSEYLPSDARLVYEHGTHRQLRERMSTKLGNVLRGKGDELEDNEVRIAVEHVRDLERWA